MYARSGNHQRAIEDFDKAIELNPQFAQAYSNRGAAYAARGQYEEAIGEYKQVLKIDPDNVQAHNNLGHLYIDREIDLEEGLRLIRKALSIAPENPSMVDSLGWAYYKKGMFDEALEQLERAIKLGGEGAEFHEHLAKVLEKKQMHEEAIKAWEKVLEIDPQHREAQRNLTRLRALIHKYGTLYRMCTVFSCITPLTQVTYGASTSRDSIQSALSLILNNYLSPNHANYITKDGEFKAGRSP